MSLVYRLSPDGRSESTDVGDCGAKTSTTEICLGSRGWCYIRGVAEQWIAYHRPSDGELTGYLSPEAPEGAADGQRFVPLNLIGHPLGDPGSRLESESVLDDRGLTSLANYWWVLSPRPFPVDHRLDLRDPQRDWEWRRIVIVELDKTECVVRPALPYPEEEGATATVTLPADDILRVGPPHTQ